MLKAFLMAVTGMLFSGCVVAQFTVEKVGQTDFCTAEQTNRSEQRVKCALMWIQSTVSCPAYFISKGNAFSAAMSALGAMPASTIDHYRIISDENLVGKTLTFGIELPFSDNAKRQHRRAKFNPTIGFTASGSSVSVTAPYVVQSYGNDLGPGNFRYSDYYVSLQISMWYPDEHNPLFLYLIGVGGAPPAGLTCPS